MAGPTRTAALAALSLALASCPALGNRLRPTADTDRSAGTPPGLCDTNIVRETCLYINGMDLEDPGGAVPERVTSEQLQEMLSTDLGTIRRFWREVGLPIKHPTASGFAVLCADLCLDVVEYVRQTAVLPPASDTACYFDGKSAHCDVDVSSGVLSGLGPAADQDLPNFHDEEIMHEGDRSAAREMPKTKLQAGDGPRRADAIDYGVWETVERVANLFRIFPAGPAAAGGPGGASLSELHFTSAGNWSYRPSAGGIANWEQGVKQREAQAKAYMINVIRAFNAKRSRRQMQRWFGEDSYSNEVSRKRIRHILNSVQHMISNVHYVYPGPKCRSGVFAYVYPHGMDSFCSDPVELPCSKYKRKFVVYLCDLYHRRPGEQVETLVHEGSHHATAYTDDVCDAWSPFESSANCNRAYGRYSCKMLGHRMPQRALKNADNFCYYVQDVANEVKLPSSELPAVPLARPGECPPSARYTRPDRQGDCECPAGYDLDSTCVEGSQAGCPTSAGTRSWLMFAQSCASCRCVAVCPDFAKRLSADGEGDCECPASARCVDAPGSSGCKKERYFSPRCDTCTCEAHEMGGTAIEGSEDWWFCSVGMHTCGEQCCCDAGTTYYSQHLGHATVQGCK